MTPQPRDVAAKVRQWTALADDDLRVAEHSLKLAPCPNRVVAYLSQQCVEKYLKALLVSAGIDFPFTHNIARLLELAALPVDLMAKLRDAESLTAFATSARYPGDDDEVLNAEAQDACLIARRTQALLQTEINARIIAMGE